MNQIPATIVDIDIRTPDIRVLHLQPDTPFAYDAGQYIEVKAPAFEARPFSIANAPNKQGSISLHVRNMGAGFSNWLGSDAVIGDVVHLSEPKGRMHAQNATGRPVFMIGGGTGVVPLLAIAEDIVRKGLSEEGITLLYGVRTTDDIHCSKELDRLIASGELTLHYCVGTDTPDKKLRLLAPDLEGHAVYISGPDPMLFNLQTVLIAHGAETDRLHTDIPLRVLTGEGA